MAQLTIKVERDGEVILDRHFNCDYVSDAQTLDGGPITIYFDPEGDVHHQLEINSLPAARSKTIKQ